MKLIEYMMKASPEKAIRVALGESSLPDLATALPEILSIFSNPEITWLFYTTPIFREGHTRVSISLPGGRMYRTRVEGNSPLVRGGVGIPTPMVRMNVKVTDLVRGNLLSDMGAFTAKLNQIECLLINSIVMEISQVCGPLCLTECKLNTPAGTSKAALGKFETKLQLDRL